MRIIGDLKLSDLTIEELSSDGKETVLIKPGYIKVWTTKKQVYEDMLGIKIFW